ncbi:biliverdin-producing heme oxygenase [Aurantimonas manganoxydans]|uniref:Heme oxygenase n=1 Tax=Aurantimonas manganoxydans TaxID=651183 RepID=A0A0P0Z5J3_9HYPH|nr:biliverdin-producing heme oxygenase [Aurantimonas manganoxydans]BAT29355.1 hypothetical protein [Aurantimonas manganoxydans SI85-9A1]
MPPPNGTFSERLRTETSSLHLRVDTAFSAFDLSTRSGYGGFLRAHARALPAVEAIAAGISVAATCSRSDLVVADLQELGIAVPPSAPFDGPKSPVAARGIHYVLEGSRLGGAVLQRRVPVAYPRRLLSARHERGGWRSVLADLDGWGESQDEPTIASAIAAATACFALFERSALAEAG